MFAKHFDLLSMRYFRFLYLLPLLFSACVTVRECPIETLQPAKLAFEGQKKNIAVCASPTIFSYSVQTNPNADEIPGDSLVLNILYSLRAAWKNAPGFEDAKISMFATESDYPLPELAKYDLIVRLDKLRLKNTYVDEQHDFNRIAVILQVYYVAEWSVRDKAGRFLDYYTDRDMVMWYSGAYSNQTEALPYLPKTADAWWDTGIAIARSYAEHVTPRWQTEYRGIYMINNFPDLSKQAYTAMRNNGFERAFNIWEEMLIACRKKGQSKTKSRIAHNMAVACEFNNSLDDAIYWIQRSINYSSNKINYNYLRILKERQTQNILLDQQFHQ